MIKRNNRMTLDGLACPDGVEYRPVCGVVAVAAAAGITFEAAWRALSVYYGPRWGGRTYDEHRMKALRKLGVKLEPVRLPRRRLTLNAALRWFRPGVRYIVRTTDHVQIIKDDIILDQSGSRPVAGCPLRRKIVKNAYRIVE